MARTRERPILGSDPDKTQGRPALVAALKQTLHSAFGVLGIHAPEEMLSPDREDTGEECHGSGSATLLAYLTICFKALREPNGR